MRLLKIYSATICGLNYETLVFPPWLLPKAKVLLLKINHRGTEDTEKILNIVVVNLKQLLALFIGGLMVVVTLVASSAYINSTIKAVTTKMSYQHNQGGVISLLAA